MRPTEWILGLLLASASVAHAQTTNATCVSNSTTAWLFSSAGQSPCLVWSRVQSLCLDPTSYINVPPLLDPSWSYELPSARTICQCNAVAYSLMAGCTYCQLGESGAWSAEQQWRDTCADTYTADGLGFVEDVQPIPAYAWRPWEGARWSPAEASQSATLYATATPTGSTSLSRSFPAEPTSTTSSSTTSPAVTPASNSTVTASPSPSSCVSSSSAGETSPAEKWGPIVGGIAGGVVALVLLFFLIRHYAQNRRSKAGQDRTEIVRYREDPDRSAARSRATSFFSMFGGYASPRGGRARDHKRETDFITDPLSFADPRPAPKVPPVAQSARERNTNDSLAYTTTQQRLKARGTVYDSDDESELVSAVMPGRKLIVSNAGPDSDGSMTSPDTPKRPRGVLKNGADHNAHPVHATRPAQGAHAGTIEPVTARQDFSQHRPYSEAATLPSLYDPPTGAPTYRGTMHTAWTGNGTGKDETRPGTMLSPTSHYPPTNRDSRASTIGAALGSGRAPMVGDERYWSRQKLPPVPDGGGQVEGRKSRE